MSRYTPSRGLESLQGRIFVLTGGANGIGAAFVKLCCENGGHVVFGDLDEANAIALQDEVNGKFPADGKQQRAVFVKTDVTKYDSILGLFDRAMDAFGHIDCAVSNAGVIEQGAWFDPSLDMKSIRQPDTNLVVDVNYLGTLYFTRIASVYLRQGGSKDKSLVLLSSVAGFKESPGLFVYQTTKHAILGLLRSLRLYAPENLGYRINAICPSMTVTAMTKGISDIWAQSGAPINEPLDIAKIIGQVACETELNGESIFVEGGRGWKFEESLSRLEPQWLGEDASKRLAISQNALGMGSKWQD